MVLMNQRERSIPKLVKAFYFENTNEFTVRGNGKNYIDAMYIDDAIRGMLKVSIHNNKVNITVDFCSGAPLTINELVQKAARTFGFTELEIEHTGQVPEYINFYASGEAMAQLFRFRPKVSLEEGLQRFAEFLKQQEEIVNG